MTREDVVSQQILPQISCHILCNRRMPLDNKYRMGPVAWPPPHAYALVISIETESGFIAEDNVTSRSLFSLPEVLKIHIDIACDVGSVVVVLMVVDFFYPSRPVSEWFSLVPPDVWKPTERRGWFLAGLLHARLRVRSQPKTVGFHDAENLQWVYRMIIRHVKNIWSVCLVWILSAKLNPSIGSHRQSSGTSL
ncbi:hypothetical protein TNCV_2156841 [Trichonephila clavipes]|nr:hypothetical protein TNCV_2156841 [Trichonephila clavipes]